MQFDRLGRPRAPRQERGLRPLYPRLPVRWMSRALRMAMSESDWMRFEALALRHRAETGTQARAYGEAIRQLMNRAEPTPAANGLDWMDWERRKALRLLPRDH